MSLGFGFSLPAYLGAGGAFSGASLYIDFTSGNNTLPSSVTFSRTTNATLTNSAGLVAYAPHNLLTYSEQFDNAVWAKRGTCTITANAITAPDGTVTADLVAGLGALGVNDFYYSGSISGSPATSQTLSPSFYIKKVSATGSVRITNANGPSFGSWVIDLSLLSTGWERITSTHPAVTVTIVYTGTGGGVAGPLICASSGTLSFYVWGAQLELGSTATTYNPTTVKNLLGYTEHFDNAAWTKSNAFVQTNLVLQSQDLDNASWVKTPTDPATFQGTGLQAVVTANYGTDINGAMTADRVQLNCNGGTTSGDRSGFNQAFTVTIGIPYTASFYVKPLDSTTDSQILASSLGILAAGSAPTSSVITDVGNGWKRVVRVYTPTSSIATLRFQIIGTTGPLTFDGLIWGAQLVQGTSAGDYKATYATAAAVGYSDIYGQPFAQKLVENTAAGVHSVGTGSTTIAGTLYTFNTYVKAAERTWCVVQLQAACFAYVNLVTGAVGTTSGSPAVAVASLGNGWYRISVTAAAASTSSSSVVYSATGDGTVSYTGDGTSGIYIFGAQLSDSASVDPYVYNPVAAPTAQAYYGPRFDYDPVTLAPKGLLIEEQRTNLLTYSTAYGGTWNSNAQDTITQNSTASPDGTVSATKVALTGSGATNNRYLAGVTITANATYTASLYLKAGAGAGFQAVIVFGTSGSYRAWLNTATGAVTGGALSGTYTNGSMSATSVGNGWWRVALTVTTATDTTLTIETDQSSVSGGYNSAVGDYFYIWGAQLEAGAFATSYIPTVASQVTRAADSASMIGNNFARWYNQLNGSLFMEWVETSNSSTITANSGGVSLNAGGNQPCFEIIPRSTDVTGSARGAGGGTTSTINSSPLASRPSGVPYKAAMAFSQNPLGNVADFSLNGAAFASNVGLTGNSMVGINELDIGKQVTSGVTVGTRCFKRVAYYSRKLAASELQGLTS